MPILCAYFNCKSLHRLQSLNISHKVWVPDKSCIFQVWSNKCKIQYSQSGCFSILVKPTIIKADPDGVWHLNILWHSRLAQNWSIFLDTCTFGPFQEVAHKLVQIEHSGVNASWIHKVTCICEHSRSTYAWSDILCTSELTSYSPCRA